MVAFLAIAGWVFTQRDLQETYVGRAFAVDGDSLRIGTDRIRLRGLDAPEYEQECQDAEGEPWRCGLAARDRLAELIGGTEVTCEADGRDQYGRALATCDTAGTDLGAALVAEGLAVAEGRYLREQSVARNSQTGIWQGEFMDPAEWRRGARSTGQDDEPLSGILDGLFH